MAVFEQIEFYNISELEPMASGGYRLQRLPAEVHNGLGIPAYRRGRRLARRLSGAELRFVVDNPFVSLTLMALDEDTHVLVYRGDYAVARHELKAGVATTLQLEDPPFFAAVEPESLRCGRFAPQVWRVLFHQDAQAAFLGCETFGASIRPPQRDEVPALRWLAYGSSITYGADALHATNAYVQQAARRLGVDVLNLGLPGSCLVEPVMIDYLAGRDDADLITCELGVNMAAWFGPEEFEERVRNLLTTLADRDPERPVAALNIYPNRYDVFLDRSDTETVRTPEFNRIVPQVVKALARPNLHFIDGRQVLSDFDGMSADLLHPADEGHIRMGENLAELLKPYLSRKHDA
ncbi:hypothetical protein PDESU_04805 [Pontiella desulfatans]|uniref:SGNH hydrolase-type esterase domain-containing protein n=1 Tax=Pontiella desulfatans TaxID=2750659 RepID=A0A6C2UA01_PONDE|nr:GDSL-type esterase/lipase family protein [Pontiella desulfatans]VGO16214.1 hypothetical protein PDESU_04805 [Pontiella desulfatans]